MKVTVAYLTALLCSGLLLLAQCRAAHVDQGENTMELRLVEIAPEQPLDPYGAFEIVYEFVNDTDAPLTIPDINRLRLEIRDDDGNVAIERDLEMPKSIALIEQSAYSKEPPYEPLELEIPAQSTERGVFRSLNAAPPLPMGQATATVRVALSDTDTLASKPLSFEVATVTPEYSRETTHQKTQHSGGPLRQKLLVFSDRVVLLSTVYPGFMSVIGDIPRDESVERYDLVHYYPGDQQFNRIIEVRGERVFVKQFVEGDEFGEWSLKTVTELGPGTCTLQSLIHVLASKTGKGTNDYIAVVAGCGDIRGEYWVGSGNRDALQRWITFENPDQVAESDVIDKLLEAAVSLPEKGRLPEHGHVRIGRN